MSNYATVGIEMEIDYVEDFEKFLEEKGYDNLVKETKEYGPTKAYLIECNHYDRTGIQEWLEERFDEDYPEGYAEVGMDECTHWENGDLSYPHVYLDVVLWDHDKEE